MKNRELQSSRRMLCVCVIALALVVIQAVVQARAENNDQPHNAKAAASGLGITKALEGIMKPTQKPKNDPPPKPAKKPDNISVANGMGAPTFKNKDQSKALNQKDTDLYQKTFALQKEGKMDEADQHIQKLSDDRLYGYVLQQRYLHPTGYKSTFDELKSWLENYADHPGARRIYDLAERKRPKGNNARLPEPETRIYITRRAEPTMVLAKQYVSSINRSTEDAKKVRELQQTLSTKIRKGELQSASNALNETTILDTVEQDILSARLASAYLYRGDWNKAYELASKAATRSGLHVPTASWVAGMVSWKRAKYTNAARYFETVGRSTYASSWTRAAGAYWAARAHMRRGDVKSVSTWLRRAAGSPRTFYGLIAIRALGEDFDFNWKIPMFTKDNHKVLSSDVRGVRAMALTKIGEISKAQAELLRIDPSKDPQMYDALLAFSGYAHLPGLAMRLGASPADKDNSVYYDAALYPTGPWRPLEGYKLNASLLNAIMRQESRFDPDAESHSGAKGLMQLMPATARSVSDYPNPQMDDPEVNLELGQRYLQKLMLSPSVDNNLLSLLIAYNAGPGNLAKWKKQWSQIKDPLLFIELLPSSETRAYVERVLSNYWIYRMRDKKLTPTLDAVVAGVPVKFASQKK